MLLIHVLFAFLNTPSVPLQESAVCLALLISIAIVVTLPISVIPANLPSIFFLIHLKAVVKLARPGALQLESDALPVPHL